MRYYYTALAFFAILIERLFLSKGMSLDPNLSKTSLLLGIFLTGILFDFVKVPKGKWFKCIVAPPLILLGGGMLGVCAISFPAGRMSNVLSLFLDPRWFVYVLPLFGVLSVIYGSIFFGVVSLLFKKKNATLKQKQPRN